MLLKLPEGFIVDVVSDVGNCDIKGSYTMLRANLQNGFFRFWGQANFLEVQTRGGNIHLQTKNVSVDARSSKGEVRISDSIKGSGSATLRSINGDILVESLKKVNE